MAWNPSKAVTDVRPLSPNLLQFFRGHQTEALSWANGGAGLVDFAAIYSTNQGLLYQIFPNAQMLRERHHTVYADDGQRIEWSFDLIYETTGADATQLKVEVVKRGYALESMIVNIPTTTLMNGVSGYARLTVEEVDIEHGPLQGEEGNWLISSTIRPKFKFTENP